jgi:predicted DNA-binding transcriptional regulator AlpA
MTASSRPKAGRPDTITCTLRDLEAVFGRRDMHTLWRKWRSEHGFPQPLPWSRRPLRWNAEAVLRWKAAREAEAGSLGLKQPEGR